MAHSDGRSSIAFPGYPCNTNLFHCERIASVYFDEISRFIDKYVKTSVKEIYIEFPPLEGSGSGLDRRKVRIPKVVSLHMSACYKYIKQI